MSIQSHAVCIYGACLKWLLPALGKDVMYGALVCPQYIFYRYVLDLLEFLVLLELLDVLQTLLSLEVLRLLVMLVLLEVLR